MSTLHVVKTHPRCITRHRVTEHTPVIAPVKLTPDARKHFLAALDLAFVDGIVAGELADTFEGIPKGTACARYHGSEGYMLHVVNEAHGKTLLTPEALADQLEEVPDTQLALDQADDLPPVTPRDLDGSIDDADARALSDGITDPDTDAEELEEANARVTSEIAARLSSHNEHLQSELDHDREELKSLRAQLATVKADHERLKAERDACAKALRERIATDERRAASIPPPRAASLTETKPATPKAIATAKKVLNAKHGKGAGRSSKKK